MEEDQSGSFYNNLLINIKEQHDLPDATASANFILSAHLHILMSIYQKYPALLTQEMLHYLLYDCLFYKKGESNQLQIACKKAETIKAALDVVSAGIANYKDTTRIMKIVTEVQQFHRLDYWRTSDNWSTSIQNEVKAKYAGLENPGCICYHNSLLQQLFMTKGFRSAITELNLKQQDGESKLEMLKSLKQLFFNLLFSEQIALNPVFFTKTIKSHDNKPLVKIFVQMDIDQFCSILFDKIEHQLNFIPNQSNIVKNIFGGIYAHQIISKECKHCSERQEQFISIGLQVKKNINESFNALIKGQMLDGENKYYCEKCDKKVKAQKILTIKKLPPNLILSIKRFEYNYQIDAKIKINDYCEFPMELNLKKYSQQEINKSNVSQTLQIPQQNVQKGEEDLPDSYFIYKLKGVVVHTGSADSGHYYSFIEDAQKNWFQFNDSSVTPFDLKNLPQEAFGSKDSYDQKVKNAYLLFYERVQVSNQPEPQKSLPSEENSEIISGIIDKNKTISKFRLLFSKDYSGFVDHLLEQISKYDLTLEQQENWYRFIVSYYLLIKIREGTVDEVLPISSKISKLLDSKPKFSSFFFSSFVNFSFIQQVFVFASNRDKVKILSRLLAKAFINAYSELPDNYNALKNTQISNLLNYIKNLTIIHGNICQLDMFIRIVLDYTRSRQDYRLFKFLQHDYEQCLLVNIFGFNFSKQQKQKAVAFKDAYKNERSYVLSQAKNQGKKYIPTSTKESWQLIQYFVQYLSKGIVQEQSSQQAELFDPLANINNIIDKAAKGGVITKVIHECGVSKSVYRLYKTFKLIKKLESLVEAIEKGLKDYESTKYRQLLLLLYFIVIDKDCTEQLISVIVDMLEKVHAINQKYFVEVNLIHQWIIKYTKDSRLFLKVLSENEQFLTIIVNWIISKPAPSADLIKKHKNPNNQKLLNRLHGILVSADPQDYHKKSKSLKKKFETIRDKNYELFNENNQWQKEYLDEFNQQNEGFYYDLLKKKWNTVKIVDNNFGYLKLAQQNSNDLYIWQDNERFFSFKTLTKQDLESSSSEEQAIVEQKMQEIEEQDLYN